MIARVGDDLFGPATIRNFSTLGIDVAHVQVTPGVPSGVAPIFVDSTGQNRILVVKGANDHLLPADIDHAADMLLRADFILLQLEIPLETVYYTLRIAHQHGIRTILNPAPAQALDLTQAALADYLIPNETEAAALTGAPVNDLEQARACALRLHSQGVARVIVTLGKNGALLSFPEEAAHIRPFPVSAIDSSGAGDAFIGSLAVFLAEGYAPREAVSRANLYAALSTLSPGTQRSFVSRERFDGEWAQRGQGSVDDSQQTS
jgi:ribokinase